MRLPREGTIAREVLERLYECTRRDPGARARFGELLRVYMQASCRANGRPPSRSGACMNLGKLLHRFAVRSVRLDTGASIGWRLTEWAFEEIRVRRWRALRDELRPRMS